VPEIPAAVRTAVSRLLPPIFCVFALVLVAVPALAQRGARTIPRNLAELFDQSSQVVRGRVLQAHVEQHPQWDGLWTVVVTLRVEETFKGHATTSLTFRQFIWDARDRMDAAGYRKGQHLLLLLNPPTPLGLSSPAGLEQGRFRILLDASGREWAVNGAGNAGLLHNLGSALKRRRATLTPRVASIIAAEMPGHLELDDLREVLVQLGRQN